MPITRNLQLFRFLKISSFFETSIATTCSIGRDVGISKEKIADVKKLLIYLSEKGRAYYDNLFSSTVVKKSKKQLMF